MTGTRAFCFSLCQEHETRRWGSKTLVRDMKTVESEVMKLKL